MENSPKSFVNKFKEEDLNGLTCSKREIKIQNKFLNMFAGDTDEVI